MASASRFWPTAFFVAVVLGSAFPARTEPPDYAAERGAMVERLRALGITNRRVLDAMQKVPRHLLVPQKQRIRAYEDIEVNAGSGRRLSRPYVAARTIQALNVRPGSKVLQIGAGCGYRTALFSELGGRVYVAEFRQEIVRATRDRLRELGYTKVTWKTGKACEGWAEHAPYDAILVICAAQNVPEKLLKQLREGGRMIVPIGIGPAQTLNCLRKNPGVEEGSQGGTRGTLRSGPLRIKLRVDPMACCSAPME